MQMHMCCMFFPQNVERFLKCVSLVSLLARGLCEKSENVTYRELNTDMCGTCAGIYNYPTAHE